MALRASQWLVRKPLPKAEAGQWSSQVIQALIARDSLRRAISHIKPLGGFLGGVAGSIWNGAPADCRLLWRFWYSAGGQGQVEADCFKATSRPSVSLKFIIAAPSRAQRLRSLALPLQV